MGFDRDRAFYPAVLIVVASYYVLFAAMIGSVETVLFEFILMTLFVILRPLPDSRKPVPPGGRPWCLAYDVGAAGALAWLLMRAKADVVGVTA